MAKDRIVLTDTFMDALMKISDGHPGAVDALMSLSVSAKAIDPQASMGSVGVLLSLDTHEIYGEAIDTLWRSACAGNTRKMLILLRSVQLGFMDANTLKMMSEGSIALSIAAWEDLDTKVCARLEDFERPTQ